jgi:hypothetical protein
LTNRPCTTTTNDLQEVTTRYRLARQLLERLAADYPPCTWRSMAAAFADIPAPTAETTRLRADLAHARLDRANLAAAALAAIAAHHDGDPDPLSYLRDELCAQGHDATGWGSR